VAPGCEPERCLSIDLGDFWGVCRLCERGRLADIIALNLPDMAALVQAVFAIELKHAVLDFIAK